MNTTEKSAKYTRNWLATLDRTSLLLVGVVLTFILALTSGVSYRHSKSALENERSEYLWMKSAENAVRFNQQTVVKHNDAPSGSLIDHVTSAALENYVEIDQYRSDADGGLNVTIHSTDFANLMAFMNAISLHTAIRIQAISVQASSTPGVVSATLKII